MITMKTLKASVALASLPLAIFAQRTLADPGPEQFNGGIALGAELGRSLSAILGESLGGTLPFELGGVAAISALSLIIGAQLIKRKK